MDFMLMAILSAAVGAVPLFFVRRFVAGGVLGGVSFFVLWGLYYLATPSTIWPLFGLPGFCVAIVWLVAAMINGLGRDMYGHADIGFNWLCLLPIGYVVLFVGTLFLGSGFFYAGTYATMIGTVEEREWTQDVQPKDPRHMRMVDDENAIYTARKVVGQLGSIGSQFTLDGDHMTLQRVKNQLVYVVPFDFAGYSTWLNSTGSPGFVIVDAEDPERVPRLVSLPEGKKMHFTPGAFFGHELERHLRNNGFSNQGFATFRFELDEEERPWWVVTTYRPTVWWDGEKVTGVAVVNPTTGEITRYSQDKAPEWIDRIVPGSFVKLYAKWRGEYSGGWLNSWWGTKDLTEPDGDPVLIYSSDNRAEWVNGITSASNKDDSLVGIMYTDSRTGKTTHYKVTGGGTDSAITNAVNNNQFVKFKHLHATTPQIYNVYGTMAAVVPLLNPTHAFQGVAFVSVANVQDVAVGATQMEALHQYQALIARRGQQIALNKTPDMRTITGIIDRIRQDIGANGGIYYFHLVNVPRIFTASSQDYAKLPLTQSGDEVAVEYVGSGEEVVPVRKFDNRSLPLDKTKMQGEVEAAATAKQKIESGRKAASELTSRIKNMTPEELAKLEELLKK